MSLAAGITEGTVVRSGYCFKMYLPGPTAAGLTPGVAENPVGGGNTAAGDVDPDNAEILWCCYAWPVQVTQTGIPFLQYGGLMKVGDELIGYGNWTQNGTNGTVTQAKRGWLNSNAELHDQGDSIFYIPWLPVAALSGDITTDDKVIRLKQRLNGDPTKYTKGYILVDNEMMLFEWNAGDGLTLSMPPRWDGQKGLYRGMFGTTATTHSATSTLVYGMPFRIWDTYKEREFDNSMVYFQWSTKMDLARWNSYVWRQDIPLQDKNILVHAFCRLDGRGDFWDAKDPTRLIESVTAGGNVKIDRTGHSNDAGQIDVRFYIEYKPGAFDAQNMRSSESWKRCPKIKELQVEYDRPTQTLHHEDR
jgi:hypothetical protein